MKKSYSTGSLQARASLQQFKAEKQINLGWAQQENARKTTTQGPPTTATSPTPVDVPDTLVPHLKAKGVNTKMHAGYLRLAVCVTMGVLSVAGIATQSMYFMPVCWFFCGTSLVGLSGVAVSCANNSFTESHFMNHVVGWICSATLLLPFETFCVHVENNPNSFLSKVSHSQAWVFASLLEWGRCQVSSYAKKRVIGNVTALAVAYAILLPYLPYFGWPAVINFFVMPWLVYHVWRSVIIKLKFKMTLRVAVMDDGVVSRILDAFDEDSPKRLSLPQISGLLGEANAYLRFQSMESKKTPKTPFWVPLIEVLFGWETINVFPAAAVQRCDPSSAAMRASRAARKAAAALAKSVATPEPVAPPTQHMAFNSALLRDGRVGVLAQMGGQGIDWFPEFQTLCTTADGQRMPLLGALLTRGAQALAEEAQMLEQNDVARQGGSPYTHGLDLLSWGRATDLGVRPPLKYLRCAPVSYPAIALTQLANYAATVDRLGCSVGDLQSRLAGATGHSQGVATSVVLATSATEEQFLDNACSMLRYLLCHGVRLQQVADRDVLGASASSTSLSRNTPMLAVGGVAPTAIQKLVSSEHVEGVELSLINSSSNCVLGGSPEALELLQEVLMRNSGSPRSARGDAVSPRSAVPFYKRKPLIQTRFLGVSVPFHTTLLAGAEELILKDIRRLGLRVLGKQLSLPVYSTDGSAKDLSRVDGDIMEQLVKMQVTQTVHWPTTLSAATANENTTHILDFGPGGDKGSAAITRRVMAERGESLPVVMCSPAHLKSDDPSAGVLGMESLLSETLDVSAAIGVPSELRGMHPAVRRTMSAADLRRSMSAPTMSMLAKRVMLQQKLGKKQGSSGELDKIKVSLSQFSKNSKGSQGALGRHMKKGGVGFHPHVTIVTD